MKAIAVDGYGETADPKLRDLPDPQPGDEEILVRVRAAGVNPLDWKILQGQLRLFIRLRFPYVPGSDIAGDVVTAGARANKFKAGDPVFAFSDSRRGGGYAGLGVINQAAAARKPDSLDYAEAASLPVAGCAALQALRDIGRVSRGARVLIHGGAGGVGHFAVQIAKALGASATATCGPSNIDFIRSLGADEVIDYSRRDFTSGGETYDVIFDAVGKSSFSACRKILAPGGIYVTTLPSPDLFLWGPLQRIAKMFGPAKQARMLMVRPNGEDLAYLGRLADEGKLKPVVSVRLPLDQAAEAHRMSQAGHVRGKIVLEV
ncbi:MAG: NAD(P)-dependent alcohol dehydrogenase [Methylocystis sp.]|jgi:NADPH:quinone reductase-like Zn-dependent oxidoreductase